MAEEEVMAEEEAEVEMEPRDKSEVEMVAEVVAGGISNKIMFHLKI